MQFIRWWLTLALVVLVVAGLPAAPRAAAVAILGGGAGIVVDGNNHCTLTTIGHDRAGALIGFTGAACGGPGAAVATEGADATVGTVVAANGDLGYAVIKFDEPDLIPLPDYLGFPINGVGPDPEWRQSACKFGSVSGQYCSLISTVGPGPQMTISGPFQGGELGAPVTADGLLIGIVFGGFFLPATRRGFVATATQLFSFNAILADVNAGNGPGSGFVPIGR